MAFDAGSIEATLTLNRNPFTAGLAAAKQQARSFARDKIEATLGIKVDQRQLIQVEAQLKRLSRMNVRSTAKVLVDRLSFDRLLKDLRTFDKSMYATVLRVDTAKATADVIAFRTLLRGLNDETVNLSANTRAFGGAAGHGFGRGASHFTRMASLIIGTLPLIATGLTAAVGGVGALASGLLIAGLGAGAFALVAVPAFKQVKAAVEAGQAEINKLPPGLREAANGMKELLAEYDKLVKANQKVTGLALSAWFNAGSAALRTLNPLVKASAEAFALAGNTMGNYFDSPSWGRFVQWLSQAMGPAVDMMIRGLIATIRVIGNLTRAFWELGGSQILGMIVSGLERFAEYTERIGENRSFQLFMESAVRSFPVVATLIGEVVEFLLKLAVGLEPLGTLIVRVFNGIFNAINQLDPTTIAAIGFAVAALMAALAMGAGGPVALGIAAIAGLATIFARVYTENERLRTAINAFVEDLRSRFAPIWQTIVDNFNNHIRPAWESLVNVVQNQVMPALSRFWNMLLIEVMPPLHALVDTITARVVPAVLRFFEALMAFAGWLADTFGPLISYILGGMVTAFDGAFQMIAGLLDIFTGLFTRDWDLFTSGIQQVTEGFWTIIAGMFGMSLDELRRLVQSWDQWMTDTWNAFWNGILSFIRGVWQTVSDIFNAALALLRGDVDRAAELIGQAWRRVANFFREPINWVIDVVINDGILRAWNTVMGWIGASSLNAGRIPGIPAFSQGGVLPGYAPRQDTLLAAVSPGEAVMVPEWTRAVGGPDAVRRMNQAAMSGGLYYEGNPRGYSLGGVIPHFAYGGVAPHVAAAGDEVTRVLGRMPGGIGGVGARANASDHPSGFALDFMTMNNVGLGNRVAGYLTANWQRLAIKYLIWLQRIASRPGDWRPMADRGSRTANHMDHVHASFLGGPGGGAAAPVMVSWWSIIADKVKSLFNGIFGGGVPGISGAIGDAINRIPPALIDKVISKIQEKLSSMMTVLGSTPALDAAGGSNTSLGFGTADRGALIPPGRSTLFNATGRAEPLVNYDLYRKMNPGVTVEDVLSILSSWDGGGEGGDTYNVMLPERVSVRELADQLDFKRRVVSKGRYSR